MKYLVRDMHQQDYAVEADHFQEGPHGLTFFKEIEVVADKIRVTPVAFVTHQNIASVREESIEVLSSR
jgi:hypothetical protein